MTSRVELGHLCSLAEFLLAYSVLHDDSLDLETTCSNLFIKLRDIAVNYIKLKLYVANLERIM